MRVIGILCVAASAFLGGEPRDPGDASDEVAQLPPAVRAVVSVLAGQAPIDEVSHSRTNGMLVHEVAWTVEGQEHEVELTDEGAIIELEDTLPAKEVPAAARAAAERVLGTPATHFTRRFIVIYEATADVQGREHEALVLPTGGVLDDDDVLEGQSLEDDDDDGEEDDDGDDDEEEDDDEEGDDDGPDDDEDDGPDDD